MEIINIKKGILKEILNMEVTSNNPEEDI